jgi:hypothetical protein
MSEGKEKEQVGEGGDVAGKGDPEPKMVPLGELVDLRKKYKALDAQYAELTKANEERANAELSEIDRLKKMNEQLTKQVGEFTVKDSKRTALEKAIGKIGDGFTLEGRMTQVIKHVDRLSFNPETVETDVMEIVSDLKIAKKPADSPVGGGSLPIGSGAGAGGNGKKATELTGSELQALKSSDPDKFAEVMKERGSHTQTWNTTPVPPANQGIIKPGA